MQLEKQCKEAVDAVTEIKNKIIEFDRATGGHSIYGSREYFLGMYERLLISLLVEGDRTDTASFMQKKSIENIPDDYEMELLWDECILHLEEHLRGLKVINKVDEARRAISEQCLEAAKPSALYRLTVPTGGGKTFSSLRFALQYARRYKKRHIIYVAPYNSILEQNAEDIKMALGKDDIVLEHHSNVIYEEKADEERYTLLTENWSLRLFVPQQYSFLTHCSLRNSEI
ncbi:DEAD/DEAH box helicase family protein [Hungatella hathewayi]|uniref:DEAD/DEAH box helicase family protein n=1 Tax=Hungatella hathewayi TaxID=154046 RepID=UPI003561C9BA